MKTTYRLNIANKRFGLFTVISRAPKKGTKLMWNCRCDCGNLRVVRGSSLTGNRGVKSCGCLVLLRMKSAGSNHPKWKGGKWKQRGYIRIKIGGIRIYEHVYNMEQYLNRKLWPKETVHHLNGVRDDNRLENLELWSSHHPPGQRVADKISWAVGILKQYNPELLA